MSQLCCRTYIVMTHGFFCSQVVFPWVYIYLVGLGEEVPLKPMVQLCDPPTKAPSDYVWSTSSKGAGNVPPVCLQPPSRWRKEARAQGDVSIYVLEID